MTEYITLPRQAKDIRNQRFGRLTTQGPVAITWDKRVVWRCVCACGNVVDIVGSSLLAGKSKSCGCFKNEIIGALNRRHGMTNQSIHVRWRGMKARCLNPNVHQYGHYGGRGITIYPEWQESFEAFFEYVSRLPNFGKDGFTLDRIDNDGNYEPGNLRWADSSTQNRNTRHVDLITYRDETKTVAEWARELNIPYFTLCSRFRYGWTPERALSEPVNHNKGRN